MPGDAIGPDGLTDQRDESGKPFDAEDIGPDDPDVVAVTQMLERRPELRAAVMVVAMDGRMRTDDDQVVPRILHQLITATTLGAHAKRDLSFCIGELRQELARAHRNPRGHA